MLEGGARSASKNSRRGITTTSIAGPVRRERVAENLSHQAFGPIPGHRVADLPARHEAEPGAARGVRSDDECDVAAVVPGSHAERVLELGAAAHPPAFAETLGLHDRRPAAGREEGSACITRVKRPSDACGPWPDDA